MKISALNHTNNFSYKNINFAKRNTYKNTPLDNDTFSIPQKKPAKVTAAVAGVIVAAGVIAEQAEKVKASIADAIKKHKDKNVLYIPFNPGELTLDTDKLRKLPKEIKLQAMEALNNAMTAQEKLAVIQKFGIGKY